MSTIAGAKHVKTGMGRLSRYGGAIAVVILAVVAMAMTRPLFAEHSPPLVLFVLAIAAAAWWGGLGPGLLATLLSVLTAWGVAALNHSLAISHVDEAARLVMMAFSGVVISLLAEAMHRAASRQEGALHRLSTEVQERCKVEASLRASEQRYRSFVEASAQVVWTTNARGEVNLDIPSWQAFTGQTAEQARGFGWMDAVRADDRPRVAEAWRRAFESSGLYEVEYLLRCHDGIWRNILARGVPVRNSDGTVREYVGTCIDITDRKRAEETRAWLASIVASSDDAIVSEDPNGVILTWNQGARAVFGYTAAEAVGRPISILAVPGHEQDILAPLSAVREGQHFEHIEVRRRRKDGQAIDVSLTLSPIHDREGHIIGISKIARDITQRKRAEEALQESERRLRMILDALPVAVFLSDPSGNVVFTNAAVERIWGISLHVTREHYGEYKGRWLQTGRPVEPEQWALARVLETGEPFTNDLVVVEGPAGQRKILDNAAIPLGIDGRFLGAVVVTEDVTQRVEAQEQIRLAKEAAERTAEELARSNTDLEQFAYVASHDLQEPLRMVTGYLQLLAQRYQGRLDEKADKYIHYAVDGAERMSGLIRDLLAYSRVNTRGESLGLASAQDALEFALKNLSTSLQTAGATVTQDPLPAVRGDQIQLAQLFQNLLGNALKFRAEGRPPEIHVAAQRVDRRWQFSVRDNGIGFEQQYEKKMFLIFQRLHDRGQYPGTGIGLAICRRIVERHGGQMWATGELGQGATFYFTLPV